MDETKITAKLPHLDVEMTREEPGPGKPEVITMRLTATPSMDAFGEHLSKGLPFFGPAAALSMMQPLMAQTNPMLAPMQAWTKMVQDAWAPFLPGASSADKIEGPKG